MDSPTTDSNSPSPQSHASTKGKAPPPDKNLVPGKGGLVSGLTNFILDAMGFEQRSSWKTGHLVGVGEGFESGREHGLKLGHAQVRTEGRLEGRTEGLEEGFAEGHSAGLDEGRLIVELRPGAAEEPGAPATKEPALFKDWRFGITPEMAAEIRRDVAHYLPSQPPSDDQWKMILSTTVLVLFRKRATEKEAQIALAQVLQRACDEKQKKIIKLLTYHSSKGLQADAVFLLGDCEVTNSSPSKNDFYAQAGMGRPGDPCGYDTAQQHEALRTAYVAITRAVTYCYWYITWHEKVPAYEKASRHIVTDEPFWEVVGRRPVSRSDGIRRKAAKERSL